MPDLLMLIEEQRAAMRDAERELGEALAAKSELDKKITYLQWHVERLKRLYALTSTLAQDEAGHAARARLPIPALSKVASLRPGTTKQAVVEVLRENRRSMTAKEIWSVLQERGVKIKSERPAEVVASIMRSSIGRSQEIFTKDGTKFGLIEWQTGRGT